MTVCGGLPPARACAFALLIGFACGGDGDADGDEPTTGDAESTDASDDGSDSASDPDASTGADDASDQPGDTSDGSTDSTSDGPDNGAPATDDDVYYTLQSQALTIDVADGVLANDVDPDGDAIEAGAEFVSSAGGSVTMGPDGAFDYEPPPGMFGIDTFAYTASDPAGETTEGIVTIHVAPVSAGLEALVPLHAGYTIDGEAIDDNFGLSLAAAGDCNGDALADLVVGAPGHDGNGVDAGRVYVLYGKSDADPIDLGALGAGGWIIDGTAGEWLGSSVDGAGDVDGDGRLDLVVGAQAGDFGPDPIAAGHAYVVFGQADRDPIVIDELGDRGFAIETETIGDQLGSIVAGLGDVDGDGLDDVGLGAPGADYAGNNAGRAYVVFGRADAATLSLAALGEGGFYVDGIGVDGSAGSLGNAIAEAGDHDGDGLADVLVSALRVGGSFTSPGAALLIFGKADSAPLSLASLGSAGVRYDPVEPNWHSTNVGDAGDVNGDGLRDLVIGSPNDDRAFVVFGGIDASAIDLDQLGDDGFEIHGSLSPHVGEYVAGGGDIDGDGLDDLVVASPESPPEATGRINVVYGKADSTAVHIDELDGTNGYRLDGEDFYQHAGHVAMLGDVDGDGLADFAVGVPSPVTGEPDRVYVVFGIATKPD